MKFNQESLFILICLLFPASAISQPDTLWTSTFDIGHWDKAESVLKTSDGYLIAGYVADDNWYSDYHVIKIDTNGSLMWQNTYSDTTLVFCSAYEILEAPADDEFYVFGSAQLIGPNNHDVRILRIDSDGNILEETSFGSTFDDWVYCATSTSDGGYVIAGDRGTYPAMDVMLIKVDSQLNVEWQKEYGGSSIEYPSSVIQTSDGGYLVTGWTYSFGAQDADCYIVKTDSEGNIEFETTYGSPLFDRMIDVCETDDNNYMGLWNKYNPHSTTIVKIDQDGIIEWQNEHTSRTANQILLNDDGTVVITGTERKTNDLWLMCADALGNRLWENIIKIGMLHTWGFALCHNDIGGYFVAAGICPISGGMDVWLLNFDSYTGITIENPLLTALSISRVSPNPFSGSVFMEYSIPVSGTAVISVHDAAGRIVASFDQPFLQTGPGSFCWTPEEDMPVGCYTLVLDSNGETVSRRCVLLR